MNVIKFDLINIEYTNIYLFIVNGNEREYEGFEKIEQSFMSPVYVLCIILLLYYLSLSKKKRFTGLIASFTEMNLNQSFWQDSKQDPKGQFHYKTAQSVQRRWVKVFNIQLMVQI